MVKSKASYSVVVAALALVSTAGCAMLGPTRQDQAIAEHALDSGFPSPSDVGYVEETTEIAGEDDGSSWR